jgi:glutamyl-tRNA reductase
MALIAVGASFRTAPVEVREKFAYAESEVVDVLSRVRAAGAREAALLSTCNRTEFYLVETDTDSVPAIWRELSARLGDDAQRFGYVRRDREAAAHLFRVAAGLDSLVVGEPQILGQVKSAFATATEVKTTGAVTNRLFTTAFSVGKRVRTETHLGEGAVSVSYAAIALAKKIFRDLKGLNVLILGAGEMAKLTAVHLQAQQVKQLTIASRTLSTAEQLAAHIGGQAVPWASLGDALAQADIVVTATGSTEPVLTRARVEEAMRPRRARQLFIIDIAVPRDVEPGVGQLDQVFLYDIDDLKAIVKENMSRRATEIERAETIVRQEVDKFTAWLQSREVLPTVIALRQRFDAIRQAELKRLEGKLAPLSPEARERVDEITHLIVEKLLLTPTEQLKSTRDESLAVAYTDAVNRLFALQAPPKPDDEQGEQS